MIINFQHIKQSFGANEVLTDVTFEIKPGERVGLIGRNGTGKSTVLKLIIGSLQPEQGQIAIGKNTRIGFLAQSPEYDAEMSVYEVLEQCFQEIKKWQQQLEQLEEKMSDPVNAENNTLNQLMLEYGKLQVKFEEAGGYQISSRIDGIANGLGITADYYPRPFSSLSGGEKTKVGLAALLLTQPDVLLLDEPTNHLDMSSIEWLETFLNNYKGTVMVISHDRYFLDRVITKIIELEDGEAVTYQTNYTGYQKEKESRLLSEFANYQEQQKKIKKMQESIKQLIEWGNSTPPNPGFHRRAASMQKALDRMIKLKPPILERKKINLHLEQSDRSGKQVISLEGISKSYADRSLFSQVSARLFYGDRIVLMGKNGCGKSTLLKLILDQENPDHGEIHLGSRVDIGYLSQDSAPLKSAQTVLQYFRTELNMEEGEARKQLAKFLFYASDVFKKISSLSGGEWSRLQLALLMYQKPNLLLLDEPTNHLDIDSREALEEALEEFPGTLLAISHDRYFINRLAHKVWVLAQGEVTAYLGNYNDYLEQKNKPIIKIVGKTDSPENIANKRGQQVKTSVSKAENPCQAATQLEKEITALEQQILDIEAQMSDPAISCDSSKLAAFQHERETIEVRLNLLYDKWIFYLN
ncbi:ATPase component of ABC transporters with duplicated ATPase domain [Desulfosporosinus orientis DSM 765]|uniref:ATPase component of ABC transporters with duplicated ATPase domain n=1 Tax=Desulfosporosinus orientis (strain ATCC 19365 / DSM 765 / NCIMB 8382 / VKM B-1628 / Singapore I) TaxID=768706 RepID=G7WJ00_DESOD|nr:ABC-F family ATP-binding cassette domain-containing protein [Desulfosporosinus orientis]AET69725.1 ATPase component of ABC transporters with duplicated ATPase domain [Desulfosporosinus orientis DSM 765]